LWDNNSGRRYILKKQVIFKSGPYLEDEWSKTPAQILLVWSCTGPENFSEMCSFLQKLFDLISRRDIQTDACPLIHMQMGKKFYALFFIFHFTSLTSLTLFVKDQVNEIVLVPH
jgi:hypothetical protein